MTASTACEEKIVSKLDAVRNTDGLIAPKVMMMATHANGRARRSARSSCRSRALGGFAAAASSLIPRPASAPPPRPASLRATALPPPSCPDVLIRLVAGRQPSELDTRIARSDVEVCHVASRLGQHGAAPQEHPAEIAVEPR